MTHRQDIDRALQRIREVVGPEGWLDAPDAMAPYLEERRGRYPGRAAAVVQPASADEVAAVVRMCREGRVGVVPQGGNTGLCGGAAGRSSDREIVLSLRRMRRIRAVDADNFTLTADAGCTLAEVHAAAAAVDRLFALSLIPADTCQIGGNLATNAGGINVLRYGNVRDQVLGLEVVLANGEVWQDLKGLRKDNAGFDLRNLFIGSEGTLGVITGAVLKLYPRPRQVETALLALDDPAAAVRFLSRLRDRSGDAVTACEVMNRFAYTVGLREADRASGDTGGDPFPVAHPWYLLVDLSGPRPDPALRRALEETLDAAGQEGGLRDWRVADGPEMAAALWRIRKHIPVGQNREGGSIKHDVSVTVSRMPEFLHRAAERVTAALPGLRVCAFGHLGDGNIHFNLTQPAGMDRDAFLAQWEAFNRLVHDEVAAMDGSFAAEHGIGQLKTQELARYASPTALALMRTLKQALDPDGILNPGKVLPGAAPGAANTPDNAGRDGTATG